MKKITMLFFGCFIYLFWVLLNSGYAADFPISTAAGYQGYPAVAYNTNKFMVVWVDGRDGGTGFDIYGQVVSAKGILIGKEFMVAQDINETFANDVALRLAYNSRDDEYLAIWRDGNSVYGQRLSNKGKQLGDIITVVTDTATMGHPDVAYNSGWDRNKYLVTWVDTRSGHKVFGRHISGQGDVGPETELTDYMWHLSAVAYNDVHDEYLVTYCPWLGPTVNNEIRAQRVSGNDLSMLGDEIHVTDNVQHGQWIPDVAFNSARRGYLVVWEDARNSSTGDKFDIYAQKIGGGDGSLIGGNFAFCEAADHQVRPSVACNAMTAGKCLVVWEDHRTADVSRIYGRWLSQDDTLEDEFVISEASDGQRHPDLASSDAGLECLVVWDDDRNGNQDIYAWVRSLPPGAKTWYVDDLNDGEIGTGTKKDPFRDLQYAISMAKNGDRINIATGLYIATGTKFIDPTCGNCDAAIFRQDIPATYGFLIRDKALTLKGKSRTGTILQTGGGYGVLFEQAGRSRIQNLTITGGVRDADGLATNGAIVVRNTRLTARNLDLINNDDQYSGDPDPVVGISGIVGREGSELVVKNCHIENNSWDGIALYRGDPAVPGSHAVARISDVTIHLGRGVGIGVTWDAQATITRVSVSEYWKGVGAFGSSQVTLKNSIVRDQLGWGVIATGTSNMAAVNNVVVNNGTTGFATWPGSTATGEFVNNIVTSNGWNDEWVAKKTGVWMNVTSGFSFAYNDVWGNQLQDVCSGSTCTPIPFVGIDGNISLDPLFADEASNDYSLLCGSPAINAGSPAILDRDGTRSDMGVYGGPDSAQLPPTCGGQADLRPTAILYDPADLVNGNPVFFDSGVQNLGDVGTGVFNVRWRVDGQDVGAYGSHAGVPANSTVLDGNSYFTWVATAGTHTISFTVDEDNHVEESNEGNNSTAVTVVVN